MSLAYKHQPTQLNIPDWLRLEADAEKVVQQLSGLKELTFYLRNPNAYIRRIALLQLGKLCLKDTPSILTQILEDNLETDENKQIAAWALNRVIKQQGVSWFLNHPMLANYTGNEDVSVFGNVRVVSDNTEVRFLFTENMDDMPDVNDPAFLKTQMADEDLQIEFSLINWLKESSADILHQMVKSLVIGIKLVFTKWIPWLGNRLWKMLKVLFKKRPKVAKTIAAPYHEAQAIQETVIHEVPKKKRSNIRQYRPKKRIDHYAFKRKVRQMFQAVFYPFKLIRRHIVFTILVILSLYALLTFTRYGNVFFTRLNPDVAALNNRFVVDARASLLTFFKIDATTSLKTSETTATPEVTEAPVVVQITYQVIATKGLNLREAPKSDAPKIVFMAPKTVVTGLGDTAVDAEGQTWLYLSTGQGKTGWAAARWLEAIEEEVP